MGASAISTQSQARDNEELPPYQACDRVLHCQQARAWDSKIRKLFALQKKDNPCQYVAHRAIEKNGKTYYKAPKVQRLITEKRIRRKAVIKRTKVNRFKASRDQAAQYEKLLSKYVKEKKAAAAHKETDKPKETK